MKVINRTNYKTKRIKAIYSAVAMEVGLTKEWKRGRNYTLTIIYSHDRTEWKYGRYQGMLKLPRYLCPTLEVIEQAYPQVFFSKHLNGTYQPPPNARDLWDPLISRFGTTQIEYPKIPKGPR